MRTVGKRKEAPDTNAEVDPLPPLEDIAGDVNAIPSAQQLYEQRRDQLKQEKTAFLREVTRTFQARVKTHAPSFVICYQLDYQWQQEALEALFHPKGYDLVYRSVRDGDNDRVFVELRIPGCQYAFDPVRV